MPDSSMTLCVGLYKCAEVVQCHMTWCHVGAHDRNTGNVYKEVVSPLPLFCVLVRHGFNKFLNLNFPPAFCSTSHIFGICVNSNAISVAITVD